MFNECLAPPPRPKALAREFSEAADSLRISAICRRFTDFFTKTGGFFSSAPRPAL